MNEQRLIVRARRFINQARYGTIFFSEIPDDIFMIVWDMFEKERILMFNEDSTGFLRKNY